MPIPIHNKSFEIGSERVTCACVALSLSVLVDSLQSVISRGEQTHCLVEVTDVYYDYLSQAVI